MSPCYHLLAPISTWAVVQGLAQLIHKQEAVGSVPSSVGTIHSFPFLLSTHFPVFIIVCLPHAHTHTCTYTHAPTQPLTSISIRTCTCNHHTVHASSLPAFAHTNTQTDIHTQNSMWNVHHHHHHHHTVQIEMCAHSCLWRSVCSCASWHMKNTNSASCRWWPSSV